MEEISNPRTDWYYAPANYPTALQCRRFFVPDDPDIVAAVYDVLAYLAQPNIWRSSANVDERQMQFLISEMIDSMAEECPPEVVSMLGTIVPYISASAPIDTLPCNGSQHLRVDYPDLYAILDSAFIVDANNFKTPDLRGRAAIGAGAGAGLTARAVGALVGTETHVLDLIQIPAHSHQLSQVQTAGGTSTANTYSRGTHQAAAQNTTSQGGGLAHNNMQPSLALNYCVVAR